MISTAGSKVAPASPRWPNTSACLNHVIGVGVLAGVALLGTTSPAQSQQSTTGYLLAEVRGHQLVVHMTWTISGGPPLVGSSLARREITDSSITETRADA